MISAPARAARILDSNFGEIHDGNDEEATDHIVTREELHGTPTTGVS
jgi:hypothetical protein